MSKLLTEQFRLPPHALIWGAAGLLIVKLMLLAWAGRHAPFVMDEMAQGHSYRLFSLGVYQEYDPIKTVIPQFFFAVAGWLNSSAVGVLLGLRGIAGLVAAGMVALTATCAYQLHRSRRAALYAVTVLLCFSTFMERAVRARNDHFAVLFGLAALSVLLKSGEKSPARTLFAGAFAGLAFLSTQKAVYWVLALGLAVILSAAKTEGLRRMAKLCIGFGLGFSAVTLIYAFIFRPDAPLDVLEMIFLSPFVRKTQLLTADLYPGLRVDFLLQTWLRNPIWYFLCGLGMWLVVRKRPLDDGRVVALSVTSCMFVFIHTHPQPWPYVFIHCLPLLSLWASAALRVIEEGWASTSRWASLGQVALFLGFLIAALQSLWLSSVFASQSNSNQLAVVQQAESLLGQSDRYFDGIGMVPSRELAGLGHNSWWDAAGVGRVVTEEQRGTRDTLNTIHGDHPKLWILNYRLLGLSKILGPEWSVSTVRVGRNLLLSGSSLRTNEPTSFLNRWPGEYSLYSARGEVIAGELLLDGKPCATPCFLTARPYILEARSAESRVFVLPDGVRIDGPLPFVGRPEVLFPNVYNQSAWIRGLLD